MASRHVRKERSVLLRTGPRLNPCSGRLWHVLASEPTFASPPAPLGTTQVHLWENPEMSGHTHLLVHMLKLQFLSQFILQTVSRYYGLCDCGVLMLGVKSLMATPHCPPPPLPSWKKSGSSERFGFGASVVRMWARLSYISFGAVALEPAVEALA